MKTQWSLLIAVVGGVLAVEIGVLAAEVGVIAVAASSSAAVVVEF